VGRQPRKRGLIDWATMNASAADLLAGLRMALDVRLPVKMLSVAERQGIEVAKALSMNARVLVLDEPTSAISARAADRLFEIVRRLKAQGVAVLVISHFIEEILSLGDEVTVLRSGRRVLTAPASELTPEKTVRAMIGADPGKFFPKEAAAIGAPVMRVRGLSGAGFVTDIGFGLQQGGVLA